MYDPDYGSVGVIFQYSYSHDNSEGIYWGCNTRGGNNNTTGVPDPEDVGCTLRYCISQNDMGDLIFFNYPSAGNEIYNNIFYIKAGLSSKIIHESGTKNHTYNFYNNIIFDAGSARYAWGSGTGVQTRNFKNNVFFGIPVESQIIDGQILTSDPQFVDPGKGTIGINALLDGYKLKSTSPALANGRIINPNGGLDFFGNLLNTISAPNRGAFQGAGVLGLENWKTNTLRIYPNPVRNNQFTIAVPKQVNGMLTAEIYNLVGQLIHKQNYMAVNSEIVIQPISILNKGVYLVSVKTEGVVFTQKISVQ
jgi:hypothetical protein